MKYLVYDRQTDRMIVSAEKPLLENNDVLIPLKGYDYSIRLSDWMASQAYDIALTNYCHVNIDGVVVKGHLSENDESTIQRFTSCRGHELKVYERRRKNADSPWEEDWSLLQTTNFES